MRLRKLTVGLFILSFLSLGFAQGNKKPNVITNDAQLRIITDTYRGDAERVNDFVPQGDGTVIDKRTGLQWMRCGWGQEWNGTTCEGKAEKLTWENAMKKKVSFADHNDWRLPTVWELESLVYCSSGTFLERGVEYSLGECTGDFQQPTLVKTAFPNAEMNYWSSSLSKSISYGGHGGKHSLQISFYLGTNNHSYITGFAFPALYVREPK